MRANRPKRVTALRGCTLRRRGLTPVRRRCRDRETRSPRQPSTPPNRVPLPPAASRRRVCRPRASFPQHGGVLFAGSPGVATPAGGDGTSQARRRSMRGGAVGRHPCAQGPLTHAIPAMYQRPNPGTSLPQRHQQVEVVPQTTNQGACSMEEHGHIHPIDDIHATTDEATETAVMAEEPIADGAAAMTAIDEAAPAAVAEPAQAEESVVAEAATEEPAAEARSWLPKRPSSRRRPRWKRPQPRPRNPSPRRRQ